MKAKPFARELEQAKAATQDHTLLPAQRNTPQKGSTKVGEA